MGVRSRTRLPAGAAPSDAPAVLLTGATGFLGGVLLRRLVQDGWAVVVLKRSTSHTDRIADLLPRVAAYDVDRVPTEAAFEGHRIDAVVHCANRYGRAGEPLADVVESNVRFGLRLLDLAVRHRVPAFLQAGTLLPRDVSPYARSKAQFLEWLETFGDRLACVEVAMDHFYGPGDDPSKFVTRVVRDLVCGVDAIALTPGGQRRDFVYVDDCADAFVRVLGAVREVAPGFRRFEVGTGRTTSIRDLVTLAWDLAGRPATRLDFGALPYRPHERTEVTVDLGPIRSLGWSPTVPLEDGLARTVAHERAHPAQGVGPCGT
jgi:CDP-paratose synthetase